MPKERQNGDTIYANTHQQVVQIMVAKTMRKIFKYYVFLKCKNFQIDRNGHEILHVLEGDREEQKINQTTIKNGIQF